MQSRTSLRSHVSPQDQLRISGYSELEVAAFVLPRVGAHCLFREPVSQNYSWRRPFRRAKRRIASPVSFRRRRAFVTGAACSWCGRPERFLQLLLQIPLLLCGAWRQAGHVLSPEFRPWLIIGLSKPSNPRTLRKSMADCLNYTSSDLTFVACI